MTSGPTSDSSLIRVPLEIKQILRRVADAERRTMSAQLCVIIEEWMAANADRYAE